MLMKKLVHFLLLVPLSVFGQLNADFESGTITGWQESSALRWGASSDAPIAGNFSLHHIYDNPAADHDQISYPIYTINLDSSTTTWRFKIRHGYTPSGPNHWGVFLISDQYAGEMHPSGSANGYVLGVNYKGTDDLVKLWKITSGSAEEILNTGFSWEENVSITQVVGFQVLRSETGLWEVRADTTGGYEELFSLGTATNSDWSLFNHFGIYYKYSSSQDMKLWLDDISIDGFVIVDTIKPGIDRVKVLSSTTLEILFTEAVDPVTALDPLNYTIDGLIGNPVDVLLTEEEKVFLQVETDFQENTLYRISVEHVEDRFGNAMDPALAEFTYHMVRAYDVQINEIMADPVPSIGLPEYEYIEIFNTTTHPVYMNGWSLQIGSSFYTLDRIELDGLNFLILCSDAVVQEYYSYGAVHGIAGFPALLNTGQSIVLRNDMETIISSVTYSDEWYGDEYKAEGGWSLEQIDPNNPCGGENNWKASTDIKGGTPGHENSVRDENPDLDPPMLLNSYLLSDTSLLLYFNEPFDSVHALDLQSYTVDHEIGNPKAVRLTAPDYQSVILFFSQPFQTGMVYEVTVSIPFTDCMGHPIGSLHSRRFGFPDRTDSLDIVVNEVLFNPFLDGVDYVEVFNRSDKVLDLCELRLASRDEQTGLLESIQSITTYPYLCFPDDYFVFSIDADKVFEQYYSPNPWGFIDLEKMPSFPNDAGRVVVIDQWLQVIDEFQYSEEMQFPLLWSVEGVSLERINPSRPTQDPTNWHSASEECGFGTPGYENSQYIEDPDEQNDRIRIEPEIFSPDNDGYRDVVRLLYQFDQPGYVATVTIFDARGRVVRKLANNEMLGTDGVFTWDGISDANRLSRMGIYLFYIEIFDLKGNVRHYKKTCVLAKKLNP